MITHRGIWAIAHMLSRKYSCIPGAYPRKHLLIPCPTNTIGGHILRRVSNKHMPASLDQGANWFGAPATNARRVSEANRMLNRTNPPIVAKIKDCKNCTHAKFAQFSNNWQRFFFRHAFAKQVVNHWPTPIANSLGSGTRLVTTTVVTLLETTLPIKKTLAQFMTYEQLFICRLSNLPPPIVSIVLRKLAIVNTPSRKQKWTFVHSVVLNLIYQKFN